MFQCSAANTQYTIRLFCLMISNSQIIIKFQRIRSSFNARFADLDNLLVIFLFLQNWRAVIIPCITIPVSLIGTLAIMSLFGFSINTLTLFGLILAVAIVVYADLSWPTMLLSMAITLQVNFLALAKRT